jgi:F-box protein 9
MFSSEHVAVDVVSRCSTTRYLYFQEDGRVLYALSSTPPHEMFRRLLQVVLHKSNDEAAVWGTYQVQKTHLSITARQEWHTVRFDLTIQSTSECRRYGALSMDRHLSSPSGCFDDFSADRVQYKVPSERFRFVRDPRL